MVPLCRRALLVCGLLVSCASLHGAVLIHEYALRGTLTDQNGENALTALGGQLTSLGYVFAANEGVSFSSRIFTPESYSIELSFKLDNVTSTAKLIDYHNLTNDAGLYASSGRLSFNPSPTADVSDFTAGTNVQVVLTRDGTTNVVTAYVNGQQRFSFVDSLSLAAPPGFSNKLNLFVDDFYTNQTNATGGTLNYVRVFNGALNPNEVSALFAGGPPIVIPEPSTCALLGSGVAAFWLHWRRRSRP